MNAKCQALTALGKVLRSRGYRFVAITPATHSRILDRGPLAASLEAIFGWNRPFEPEALDADLFQLLQDAGGLAEQSELYKSRVRFATIADLLFVHSAFPTVERDAVFFGPDTYRFVRLVRASLADVTAGERYRVIDIGSGSGAGGIFAAQMLGPRTELILADINRMALAYCAVNANLNDLPSAKTVYSDVLAGIEGQADIIVANAPYLVDEDQRLYRHGGGELGISLSLRIAEESLAKLTPGGRLILYSGTPIIDGADPLFDSLQPLLQLSASHFVYEEIDPDVFGEELDRPVYANADRIAAIGLTVMKRG